MKKYFMAVFILITSFATAQVSTNDELKGLIGRSFTYDPKIKEAENQVVIAQQRLNLSKTNMPTVDANASYTYVQPKISLPLEIDGKTQQFQFAPVNNVNAGIAANYVLFDFGRLKATIARSKSDLKYATDNVLNVQTQLASQVTTVYYNIVYLKKAIAIEDSVLDYLRVNKTVAENKLKNGDAIRLDVLNLQSQVDAEENHKADLVNNMQKQITLLQFTTGSITVSDTMFDFNIVVQNAQDAFSNAVVSAVDFVLARDRIQQAQADLALTRLTDKPSFSLGANAGVRNGYVPEVNRPKFNYAAGVSLNVPIYNTKTKKQLAVAESQVKQNQLAQETLNNEYQKNIQQALIDIRTNSEKINNMQSQIATAVSAQQIASSRYLNGIGLNTDITTAAVNLQRVKLTQLQYEYQLCLAKIEYARLTGIRYW